jgi:flagellar assembly factor FliW
MQIKTAVFGEVSIDPSTVITFDSGLPGFEDSKRFKLLHKETEDNTAPVVFLLQSLDHPEISFSVADPATFGFNYNFSLTDAEVASLGDGSPEDVLVLVLLFKDDSAGGGVSSNVKSPLLINTKSLKGLQKVLVTVEPTLTIVETKPVFEFNA